LKLDKLLAGTLALILIAGASPAFANEPLFVEHSSTLTPSELSSTNADESDAVFDNGGSDFGTAWVFDGFPPGLQSVADDFILAEETLITDVHMDIRDFGIPVDSFTVIIYFDNGGIPGLEVGQSEAINIDRMDLGDGDNFRYWFDLEDPILIDGGVTYWLEVKQNSGDTFAAGWWSSDSFFGNGAVFLDEFLDDWTILDGDLNFVLTSQTPVVGGELLPIDTTALMLAGLQSSAIWMLPVLAGIAGTGFYLVKFRTNKE